MPFEVLPFSRFYWNDRNLLYHLFGLLVPGFMPRESKNFAGILSTVQLNPVPVFGAIKIPVPFDGNFPPKFSCKWWALEVLPFFPFLRKWAKFSVPFVWITSSRLHVERRRKIYRYFLDGITQSRSCFWCQKKYRHHLTEIFDPNFGTNSKYSPPPGGTWVNFCWVCATGPSEPGPNYRLFCAQRLTPS